MIPKQLKDAAKKLKLEIVTLYGGKKVKVRDADNNVDYMTVSRLRAEAKKVKATRKPRNKQPKEEKVKEALKDDEITIEEIKEIKEVIEDDQ